ncbi:hypothetical protein [Paenibacillus antri]|uniref:hypothetical protein n=1 Tax=Paenibacillus antri TaxID=2582848 RepID=UPI00130523E1|nr:hypothetical protein [Paenibacillus antri]
MNIMDGMDAARFTSGNPGPATEASSKKRKRAGSNAEPAAPMPQVLRNLNNK